MLKRTHHLYFVAGLLLALLLLSLSPQRGERVKLALGFIHLPLFGLAGSASGLADLVSLSGLSRKGLLEENRRLQQQLAELRMTQQQTAEALKENDRLRSLVGWQLNAPAKRKLAKVVARDPANWWRTVQIDLGSRDGLHADLPVMTPEGLAGRVSSVGVSRSTVTLVGDPNCRVACLVQETRDNGIVGPSSSGSLDQQLVYLTYVSQNSRLTNGQMVVTSGLGGVFPKGIPLGRITDVRTAGYGLFVEAQVKLLANLNHLEEVWVMLP